MKIQIYQPQAIHELGQRSNQEDTIYPALGAATTSCRLFLVCDGMGGHEQGEVASAAVILGLSRAAENMLAPDQPFTDQQFQDALSQAYDTLDAADIHSLGRMGTTMTFLCLHKGGCLVAHIGDSRVYHLRPRTGEVLFRSRDHSLVQQLYDVGEISYNEMSTSPRRNIILKAMQPHQDDRYKATLAHITDIQPGDYFYLCSDGMLEEMDDDELMGILSSTLTDEEKAARLISLTASNADNHSAYLIQVKDVEPEAGDDLLSSDEAELRLKNKALHDPYKDVAWDADELPPSSSAAAAPAAPAAPRRTSRTPRWLLPALLTAVAALAVAAFLLLGGSKPSPRQGDAEDDEDAGEAVERLQPTHHATPAADGRPDQGDTLEPPHLPVLEYGTKEHKNIQPDQLPTSQPRKQPAQEAAKETSSHETAGTTEP